MVTGILGGEGVVPIYGYVSGSKLVGVWKPLWCPNPSNAGAAARRQQEPETSELLNHRGRLWPSPTEKRCRRKSICKCILCDFHIFFSNRQLCNMNLIEPVSAVDRKKGIKKEQFCWILIFTVNVCLPKAGWLWPTCLPWAQLSQDTSCTICHAAGPIILGILPTSVTKNEWWAAICNPMVVLLEFHMWATLCIDPAATTTMHYNHISVNLEWFPSSSLK